jgi:hypothetical protein
LDGEDFCEIGVEHRFLLGLSNRDISVFSEYSNDGGDRFRFKGLSSSERFKDSLELVKGLESSILLRRVGVREVGTG